MSPRIKICGVKRPQDIRAVVAAGADAIGLNFVQKSPRYVGPLSAAEALIAAAGTARKLVWCGVFVNAALDDIASAVSTLKLNVVQLHGDETPAFAQQVKARCGVEVWKAFRVATAADLAALAPFRCDGWVLDSKVEGVRGGSGKTFDWSLLSQLDRSVPLILSGGLNPSNVATAIAATKPKWVDVASGVESAPGEKDASLITEFVAATGRS